MKRMLTLLLALVLIFSVVPVSAEAALPELSQVPMDRGISEVEQVIFPVQTMSTGSNTKLGMADIAEGEHYVAMSTSQDMIDLLKDAEGFSATPYADNTQWTVGYGSYCGDYPEDPKPSIRLTEKQAAAMLKEELEDYFEPAVNDFCESLGKQPTQQQFDALLDFTYNVGGSWMRGSKLATWLENPTTELDLVNAMGAWCRAGSELSYTLSNRRIREALVFVYGTYYRPYGSTAFESDVAVLDDDELPHYKFTIYRANGGTFSNGKNYCISYYMDGTRYGEFPVVTNRTENLRGWQITVVDNVKQDTYEVVGPISVVKENLQVRASWGEGSLPEPEYEELPGNDSALTIPFTDVASGTWFYDAVKYVYHNGMMNGISDTEFDPAGQMTRGMLVAVLYRLDGSPAVTDDQRSGFTDTQGAYYTDAIDWAYANGIVNGVDATTFAPGRVITRQETITIFHRYCVQYHGLSTDKLKALAGFTDAADVAPFAVEPFQWAVGIGLVEGSADGEALYLKPNVTLNRAQAAVLLMRCAELVT